MFKEGCMQIKISRLHWVFGAILGLNLCVAAARAETVQSPDTQQQRRAAQRQEQERAERLQAPQVDLQGAVRTPVEALVLPVETPCFKISKIQLDVPSGYPAAVRAAGAESGGNFRFARNYLARYNGQCIGDRGIGLIVERLSALIADKGYSTTRVGIPEQDIGGGTLKLMLAPGLIGRIYFAGDDNGMSWKSAFPTRSGDLLDLRELEQGLEQMKRVPSQDVEMNILPGKTRGESDVEIVRKRGRAWRLSTTLDDSGALSTGKLQAGLYLALDNPLGLNDLFSIGINSDADGKRTHGTRGSNAYYSVPWGNLTFTVLGRTSYYVQHIAGTNQSFNSSGISDTLEFKGEWRFHRDQRSKSDIQLRTGSRRSRAYINDTEIAVQHTNTAFAEVALLHKRNIGRAQLDLSVAYRQGTPWFGGKRDPSNLVAGSARYQYNLETLDATLIAPFTLGGKTLRYSGILHAQNSNSVLYASEWITLGNRWTVRGFDGESALGSEKGFYLRNELGIPISGSGQSAYLGLDLGKVFGSNVTNLVGDKLAGAVFGLRGGLDGMSYDMFAGWSLYKPKDMRTAHLAAGISLSYLF